MSLDVTYGSPEGPVYLNIKGSSEASRIFVNFVSAVVGDVPHELESGEYTRLKQALEEYNAVYRFNQAKSGYIRKHFIRFGSEKDLTLFLLRYA